MLSGGDVLGWGEDFGGLVVLCSLFSVLCSRFSVLGSRFSVLGSRFSVLGSRFAVLGSRFAGRIEAQRRENGLGKGRWGREPDSKWQTKDLKYGSNILYC